ncbi:serine/threonine protein kinase [Gracilaria domingensis]|nr:serine/threonine protein kinase [Gracilaria domingensis]
MYDSAGWVKVRHSLFSRAKVWYMRLHGSSLTLHESIDKPLAWEYSVIDCKVNSALLPRSFSVQLLEGEKLRVSCDYKEEATMWKRALTKASKLIFEHAVQLLEPFHTADNCHLFKARDKSDETQVLVQRIAKGANEAMTLANTHAHTRHLYSVLTLRHRNLMGATKVFNDIGYSYVVSKWQSRRTLADVISERGGTLPEGMARIFTIQLVQALQFMHSKGVVHRNVTLENVWYDGSDPFDERVVLSNFEHVAFVDDEEDRSMQGRVGDELHQAPEMLEGGLYSAAVDLFSLGVCVYRMLSGSYPFEGRQHGSSSDDELEREVMFEAEVWSRISMEAKAFVQFLLDPCGITRLTAKEAEDDDWFRIDLPKFVDDCVEHTRVKTVEMLEGRRDGDKPDEELLQRLPECKSSLCHVKSIKAFVEHDEEISIFAMRRLLSPISDENLLAARVDP